MSDWTPDQPLRADATDEQIAARESHVYDTIRDAEYGDSKAVLVESLATVAREYSAACVLERDEKWTQINVEAEARRKSAVISHPELRKQVKEVIAANRKRQSSGWIAEAVLALLPLAVPSPDSARLDWLEAHGSYVSRVNAGAGLPPWEVGKVTENGEAFGHTAREAIDAAMREEPGTP
jgi:hypothetical protein